jgi:hypothetical protein
MRLWVSVGLAALALLEPLHASTAYCRMTRHRDTRIQMFEYVTTALPPTSRVATYGPSVTWRSTMPRWLPTMFAKDPAQSWAEVLRVLKSQDIQYVLVHQSPLDVFSPEIPELYRVIRQSATLVKAFSPYKEGAHPAPLFDRNDAYYFPVGQFSGIVRPGPFVQLYRLD